MTSAVTYTPLQLPVFAVDQWAGNTVDPDGVEWWVTREEGWSSTPDIRLDLVNKARADGAFDAPGYRAPRVITLEGVALAPRWEAREMAKNRLAAVLADATTLGVLRVQEQLFTRQVRARLSGPAKMADRTRTTFQWSLQLTAPNPVRLSAQTYQASCGLAQQGPGLSFPAHFPLDFGSGAGGSLLLTNQGSAVSLPQWWIYGPCDYPVITNTATGRSLAFDLTLGEGEPLKVDVAARTVTLGGANRRATLRPGSIWFGLPAYQQTPIAFSAAAPSGTAQLTAYWSDAWI
ncbi:hypothetical protein KALB_3863 [Kutzneria albida DSM 43870]|uniref:Siphovirus-type tail component C-terminal domain-containing protein n=1 Tax=Kutzneria albida DSM 43870 TaxID=1449976 RepID=W5W8J5_9PSEU|nr:hypothetical protein KALB_3863 [Kutzneria albida DSM 43870]